MPGANTATLPRRRFGFDLDRAIAELARRGIRDAGRIAEVTQSRGTGATHTTNGAAQELDGLLVRPASRISVETLHLAHAAAACLPWRNRGYRNQVVVSSSHSCMVAATLSHTGSVEMPCP